MVTYKRLGAHHFDLVRVHSVLHARWFLAHLFEELEHLKSSWSIETVWATSCSGSFKHDYTLHCQHKTIKTVRGLLDIAICGLWTGREKMSL